MFALHIVSATDCGVWVAVNRQAYHTRVGTRLCNVHKRLRAQEKKNYETEMMKGELSAQRQGEFKELNDEVGLRDLSWTPHAYTYTADIPPFVNPSPSTAAWTLRSPVVVCDDACLR
eukprot:COSAG05_NODE_2843_length_2581_cov_1.765915_3_plen_117_part_00